MFYIGRLMVTIKIATISLFCGQTLNGGSNPFNNFTSVSRTHLSSMYGTTAATMS
jgi:hypothetical protein